MKGVVFIAVRDPASDLFPQKRLNFLSVFGFGFGTFEAFMNVGDLSTPINQVASRHGRWIEKASRCLLGIMNKRESHRILRHKALVVLDVIIDTDANNDQSFCGVFLVQPSHRRE